MLTERFGFVSSHLLAKKVFGKPVLASRALASRVLVGAIALLSVGILPAQAEVLKDWQYDAQTRSLTLTLPDSVIPLLSVVASDQLVLELPNTQVGDVMGQSIRDGLVDSIVLEQATPETVWVVMDFAEGTVLSDSQDATLLAETEGGDRRWQVRPALVAASLRAASQSVASANIPSVNIPSANIPTESAASALRTPAPAIAQSSDVAELPVLEPAMPMNEPVSVPPLNALPIPMTDTATPAVVVPLLEDSTANDSTATVPLLSTPAASVPDRPFEESLPPVFEVEVIPAEPPVASQPVPDEIVASGPESLNPVTAVSPTVISPTAVSPTAVTIDPVVPVIESVEPDLIQPSNVSRWPEPIPFGQPLPR